MFLERIVCIIQCDPGQAVMGKALGRSGMFGGFFVYSEILVKFVRLHLLAFLENGQRGLFFKIIVGMKNLVVLSGAGMSAESGISTFRDAGGLWDRYPVEQVATPEGYARNPELVVRFYNERRKQLLEVVPNRGHELLAELEKDFRVTIVTQNIDNLHERAGSSHIIHLHGELTKVCSSRDPNNPHYIKELRPEEFEVKMGDLAGDGSQLRPFIVWFGESVPEMETAINWVEKADIFVIIGTSMNVYPAAGLLNYVPRNAEVYLIDPKPVDVHSFRPIHVIQKGASEGVADLMKRLLTTNQA